MITIWTIRRRYNRIQKKLEETLPEIKKIFEDILFTNKIYTESEIYKNFEDIVEDILKISLKMLTKNL